MKIKRVGGLTFIRVLRLQLSFCICHARKAPAKAKPVSRRRAVSTVRNGRRVLLPVAI